MGGESGTLTSELARNDGTVTEGFSLQYSIRFYLNPTQKGKLLTFLLLRLSCSISDGDSVVVTGGHYSKVNVVRYNESGFVEDLPKLITGRDSHACSWYINSQDKMVKTKPRPRIKFSISYLGLSCCWWSDAITS